MALADPTRRAILERLAHGEASGTELARPFSISVPAISKHLRVLEKADLILHRKDGRTHRFRLAARPMREAAAWLEHYRRFWEAQFDSLDTYLLATAETERSEGKQGISKVGGAGRGQARGVHPTGKSGKRCGISEG